MLRRKIEIAEGPWARQRVVSEVQVCVRLFNEVARIQMEAVAGLLADCDRLGAKSRRSGCGRVFAADIRRLVFTGDIRTICVFEVK